MRNWRIISTIAAVVLAAIAGVLVWKYVTDADTRAEKDKHLVTVLVAKERIARGTVFDQVLTDKQFETVKVPEDSLPPEPHPAGHATRPARRSTRARSPRPTSSPARPVVADQFVQSSQLVNTVAGAIPKGKQAITVSLDQTHAVGGFLTPGDKVNIILNLAGQGRDRARRATTRSKTTAFLLPGREGDRGGFDDGPAVVIGARPTRPPSGGDHDDDAAADPAGEPDHARGDASPGRADRAGHDDRARCGSASTRPGSTPKTFKSPEEIVEAMNLFDQPLSAGAVDARPRSRRTSRRP